MEFTIKDKKRKREPTDATVQQPDQNTASKPVAKEESNSKKKKRKHRKKSNTKAKVASNGESANSGTTNETPAGSKSIPKGKNKRHRDFPTDLMSYLDSWKNLNNGSDWKFNKILQTWATSNILSYDKINKPLFREVCPYILTIQGGARDRLIKEMKDSMEKFQTLMESESPKDQDEHPTEETTTDLKQESNDVNKDKEVKINPRIAFKRAKIILSLLEPPSTP